MALKCPRCREYANVKQTKYGIRCQCDDCGLWSWDYAPLADAETHEARIAAHHAFDQLWRSGLVKRSYAYQLLAEQLEIEPKHCHMKQMDAETARKVPFAVERIRQIIAIERNEHAETMQLDR